MMLKHQKDKLSPQGQMEKKKKKKTDKQDYEKRINAITCQITKDFLNNIDLNP